MTIAAPTASAASAPGVTKTTITVGIPYVDLAAVDQQFGLHINQGSYPDAYNALFAYANAHGGINGRTLKPVFVAVNPTGTAAAAAACTTLTEDTPVFVALSPVSPECFLEHGVPTMNSTVTGTLTPGSAQNFSLTPPSTAYDPIQLAVLAKQGVFKGKKVAVFGETADAAEVKVVDSALAKDHVSVVQSAIDSAPTTDSAASAQQQQIIAQKFQSAGANEVVAVGTGSSSWPTYEQQNQATYNPPWVATSETDLDGTLTGDKSADPTYLKNVVTTAPTPSASAQWQEPAIEQCVRIIKKAYPNDSMASPVNQPASQASITTYTAPINSCTAFGLFETIAKGAGKSLTTSSFTKAGYGLRNVTLPGVGTPVSFAQGQSYPLGPVYVGHYDASTGQILLASKASAS
jgi:Periplasmic binding protein